MPAVTILAEGLRFPEGPVALADGSVLVVELAAGRLSRCLPPEKPGALGRVLVVAETGGGPNGAAIGPDGACYVCNNGGLVWHNDPDGGLYPEGRAPDYAGGRIERVDLASGRVERLYDRTDEGPLLAPNDIVFDAHGGFWFTDLGSLGLREIQRGRICYAKADGSGVRQVLHPMLTPNGIGLSPDGRTLYVAETYTARLWAFEISAPGELRLKGWPSQMPGTLLYAAPHYCMFDSLAVEAGGNVCVASIAMPETAGVTVIAPDGRRVEHVHTPDRFTTNVCFGGDGLRTAYVTLSRSGRLGSVPWARPGLPLVA